MFGMFAHFWQRVSPQPPRDSCSEQYFWRTTFLFCLWNRLYFTKLNASLKPYIPKKDAFLFLQTLAWRRCEVVALDVCDLLYTTCGNKDMYFQQDALSIWAVVLPPSVIKAMREHFFIKWEKESFLNRPPLLSLRMHYGLIHRFQRDGLLWKTLLN